MKNNDIMIEVKNLKTYFYPEEGTIKAVDDVSFKISREKTLGIIGESGCGKSITARSILGIIPKPGKITSGEILLYDNSGGSVDLCKLPIDGKEIRGVRGKQITMIFQEPMASLSPVHTIGNQIVEAIRLHITRDKKEAKDIAIAMLEDVHMPDPVNRMNSYPFELSGGLRQRAMIAMALSCNPDLLIADEPTTALDVTVQAQILDLMNELQEKHGMSILYITHNLGVMAENADDVVVMYLGKIVEQTTKKKLFRNPMHPYTVQLFESIPELGTGKQNRLSTIKGSVPVPLNLPDECGFFPRCSEAKTGVCDNGVPPLIEVEKGHFVRCIKFAEKNKDGLTY